MRNVIKIFNAFSTKIFCKNIKKKKKKKNLLFLLQQIDILRFKVNTHGKDTQNGY